MTAVQPRNRSRPKELSGGRAVAFQHRSPSRRRSNTSTDGSTFALWDYAVERNTRPVINDNCSEAEKKKIERKGLEHLVENPHLLTLPHDETKKELITYLLSKFIFVFDNSEEWPNKVRTFQWTERIENEYLVFLLTLRSLTVRTEFRP